MQQTKNQANFFYNCPSINKFLSIISHEITYVFNVAQINDFRISRMSSCTTLQGDPSHVYNEQPEKKSA